MFYLHSMNYSGYFFAIKNVFIFLFVCSKKKKKKKKGKYGIVDSKRSFR